MLVVHGLHECVNIQDCSFKMWQNMKRKGGNWICVRINFKYCTSESHFSKAFINHHIFLSILLPIVGWPNPKKRLVKEV